MMRVKKFKINLFFLILLPMVSHAKDFKILDYHNGINTNQLPCKMKLVDNWFTNDQYMCAFNNSSTDVIEFQSDFISEEVYQIDRYILLDNSDAKILAKKILKKYGKPNSSSLDKSFPAPLPIMLWGNAQLEPDNFSIIYPEKQGVALSSRFLKCSGSSLGKCRSIFNVTTNSPNKIVLQLTIFDAARHAYSKKVIETGKVPEAKKPAERKIKETQSVNNIKL